MGCASLRRGGSLLYSVEAFGQGRVGSRNCFVLFLDRTLPVLVPGIDRRRQQVRIDLTRLRLVHLQS